jgi:hypothetical protein
MVELGLATKPPMPTQSGGGLQHPCGPIGFGLEHMTPLFGPLLSRVARPKNRVSQLLHVPAGLVEIDDPYPLQIRLPLRSSTETVAVAPSCATPPRSGTKMPSRPTDSVGRKRSLAARACSMQPNTRSTWAPSRCGPIPSRRRPSTLGREVHDHVSPKHTRLLVTHLPDATAPEGERHQMEKSFGLAVKGVQQSGRAQCRSEAWERSQSGVIS